jgi:hypothetical protein
LSLNLAIECFGSNFSFFLNANPKIRMIRFGVQLSTFFLFHSFKAVFRHLAVLSRSLRDKAAFPDSSGSSYAGPCPPREASGEIRTLGGQRVPLLCFWVDGEDPGTSRPIPATDPPEPRPAKGKDGGPAESKGATGAGENPYPTLKLSVEPYVGAVCSVWNEC